MYAWAVVSTLSLNPSSKWSFTDIRLFPPFPSVSSTSTLLNLTTFLPTLPVLDRGRIPSSSGFIMMLPVVVDTSSPSQRTPSLLVFFTAYLYLKRVCSLVQLR